MFDMSKMYIVTMRATIDDLQLQNLLFETKGYLFGITLYTTKHAIVVRLGTWKT